MATIIAPPKVTKDALDNLLDNMYITNVSKRLRELNQPNDTDRKRWIWELIQNAKDTIAKNPTRSSISVRIIIDGDTVRFLHNGDPFTADARMGLLWKYSDGKETSESTGRFGTGFLTTHCLSKTVTIESNLYGDNDQINGFSVTMYRDGLTKDELLEGLAKMKSSEKYYAEPFEWTTFTYHVSSESGRKAIQLGCENFKQNIAQTMLFCPELESVELDYNGEKTSIVRLPEVPLEDSLIKAGFEIHTGERCIKREFIMASFEAPSAELTARYKKERSIRLNAAIEVDDRKNVISHKGETAHYCVLPLVGIEAQLQEPLIINSPDFEPDSERQSLLLLGEEFNQEKGVLTENGINRLIYKQVFPLYQKIVTYLAENDYNQLYVLAEGLKGVKQHEKLDVEWYRESVLDEYRSILMDAKLIGTGADKRPLKDCIFAKNNREERETKLYNLLLALFPNQLTNENHEWAHAVWSDGLDIWDTEKLCSHIENAGNWELITISEGNDRYAWYNSMLEYILEENELLLKEHALLPDMNGNLKKRTEELKQAVGITEPVINLLAALGLDVKHILLHAKVSSVSLEGKYNSQSFSADINKQAKSIIEQYGLSDQQRLQKLKSLLAVVPTDEQKYENFTKKRSHHYSVMKSLFSITDAVEVIDNSLLKNSWEECDKWFKKYVLTTIVQAKSLNNMPNNLDAEWLNECLQGLELSAYEMNTYAVLPNQNGVFREYRSLREDAGIPEVLKADIFGTIGLQVKDALLHSDFCAKDYSITDQIGVEHFIYRLNQTFEGDQSYSYPNATHFYHKKYHQYPQNVTESVAKYMVRILPKDNESSCYKTQNCLAMMAGLMLDFAEAERPLEIDTTNSNLWTGANYLIIKMLVKAISEMENISKAMDATQMEEDAVINMLNFLYDYMGSNSITYSSDNICPNQNGDFDSFDNLKKESESIDGKLKDIIALIVSTQEDFRSVLMDTRCISQPQKELKCSDAYSVIDRKVEELYESPRNWEDENFKKAVDMLLNEWADENEDLFSKTNFPHIFSKKDSINMNVVWTKAERKQMQTLKTQLSSDQLQYVVENSQEISQLADKLTDKEAVIIELNRKIAELERKLGNENPSEVLSIIDGQGELCELRLSDTPYAGLSKVKMLEVLKNAKDVVLSELKKQGFDISKANGLDGNSYGSIDGIVDPDGNECPIVVHSHVNPNREFALTALDWLQLSRPNSMLYIVRGSQCMCVPFHKLATNRGIINLSFSTGNFDYRKRMIALAEIMRGFKGLHFNFGTLLPVCTSRAERFNQPAKELVEVLGKDDEELMPK